MDSYYSEDEVKSIGFAKVGADTRISRNAKFYNEHYISIGNHVRIDDFCILSGRIIIDNYIHIAAYSSLFAGEKQIHIGDFSNISSHVSIYAKSDDYSGLFMTNPVIPPEYTNIIEEPVEIHKHTIIGTMSVILPGVELGEGVAIGACSLVLKNCEAWGIYAGCPVTRIKERSKMILSLESKFVENELKKD